MAKWNDQPPRGKPMVKVDGFPGPLYPPDAAEKGKTPSKDSDFVVAVKRTLGRIGAWPWDPDGWDDTYSNRFAHGDGWDDETHAGVEGVQKWAGTISPITGWTGEGFFNFLRSVVVPQGRTHAGEMAMDSVAINLVNAAYEKAYPPKATQTVREAALSRAVTQIGQHESPPESNLTQYGNWYGENGVPWCAIFASWCYEYATKDVGKGDNPHFRTLTDAVNQGKTDYYDYVPYIVSDARNGRNGLVVTSSPIPGDLVCYDWNYNGEYDHVGLFEKWMSGSQFQAIEGNTSTSNNSNGGQVMRRQRDTNSQATTFVRVSEP